ncbi:MAG TPA: hypothetical protein VNM45_10845 [Bacillus sp. (in: firmicutes)]|nr:hypothetical protein [Bacillus sp. (in: firmicutes)]
MYRQNIPGFGFPPGPPPGGGFPDGGGMGQQPPLQPPPSFTPSLSEAQTLQGGFGDGPSTYAVDPGALRGCLYRYTYVWLRNGRSFWFYPTFIGRRSVAGYRWSGFGWYYFGLDTRRIVAFRCF